ncbi:DUF397 domain-containing protein [Streptomyces niveiscabiei]|uniref:DUF397 domain-containing protein n=1 Tax=Streptomyces niveiscabiei TaxID=164115 RepID=A0ABW9I545_9ACTN
MALNQCRRGRSPNAGSAALSPSPHELEPHVLTTCHRSPRSSTKLRGEACVEVAHHDGHILMRQSDNPTEVITTTPAKLAAFLAGAKAGEFDHFLN